MAIGVKISSFKNPKATNAHKLVTKLWTLLDPSIFTEEKFYSHQNISVFTGENKAYYQSEENVGLISPNHTFTLGNYMYIVPESPRYMTL